MANAAGAYNSDHVRGAPPDRPVHLWRRVHRPGRGKVAPPPVCPWQWLHVDLHLLRGNAGHQPTDALAADVQGRQTGVGRLVSCCGHMPIAAEGAGAREDGHRGVSLRH